MRCKNISALIWNATDGVVGTITDAVLLYFLFLFGTVGASNSYTIHRAMDNALEVQDSGINYASIKQALYTLTKQGFIKRSGPRTRSRLTITDSGLRRIRAVVPQYQRTRKWDGSIYLISYDIATSHNRQRNLLRLYLKRLGCAILQESLWLTPYNPQSVISAFLAEKQIKGTILISKMGKKGAIGDLSLKELLVSVYHLVELKIQYRSWISSAENITDTSRVSSAIFAYISILKSDPQLPFTLEPTDLCAKEAYALYRKLLTISKVAPAAF